MEPYKVIGRTASTTLIEDTSTGYLYTVGEFGGGVPYIESDEEWSSDMAHALFRIHNTQLGGDNMRDAIFQDCETWIDGISETGLLPRSAQLARLRAYQAATVEQLPTSYLESAHDKAKQHLDNGAESQWWVFAGRIRYLVGGYFHRAILER